MSAARSGSWAGLVVEDSENGRIDGAILSFARDRQGEVYVLTTGFEQGSGKVRRIVAAE